MAVGIGETWCCRRAPMTELAQRTGRRFNTKVAVSVTDPTGERHSSYGETRDISVGGVYFYTPAPLPKARDVRLVLQLPVELIEEGRAWLICDAEVLRVEQQNNERFGIAAKIKHYEVLKE